MCRSSTWEKANSAVRDHLASAGDFSCGEIGRGAEEAYELERRYSPAEYERYLAVHGDSGAWWADPDAVRRDIEQMRIDGLADLGGAPHT